MEYMRIEDQFPRLNNCAVTLGKFDGIHRGHRKLMDKILERKKKPESMQLCWPLFLTEKQFLQIQSAEIFWNTWEQISCWNVR